MHKEVKKIYLFVDFQKKYYGRIMSKLEEKKINYIIIEPRNNYDVEEKSDNRNLNTYEEEFKKAYLIEQQKRRVKKINEKLNKYVGQKEFKIVIKKMEEILNEN